MESLASRTSSAALQLRFAQNDNACSIDGAGPAHRAGGDAAAVAVWRPGIRVVYPRHGAGRRSPDHFDWLGTLEWLCARGYEVRLPFSYDFNMGSGGGAIRRAALHLRHADVVPDRVVDRSAVGNRDGGLSDRACAALDSAATRFANRNAGGDPERHPGIMGNFRHDPVAARLSVSMAQTIPR